MPTQNIFDLLDTWASGGGPYTSIKMDATDNDVGSASLLMDLQVGSSSRFKVDKNGVATGASFRVGTSIAIAVNTGSDINLTPLGQYSWGSSTALSSADTILTRRGTANLRLGAADAAAPVAQTLSVQSVVAGTTNTAGANLTITGSQGTGTGAGGSIIFQVAPAGGTGIAQNALATAWTVNSSGHLLAGTDNLYDIGAAGATRPRNVYVAYEAVIGDNTGNSGKLTIGIGISRGLHFGNRGCISAVADGIFALQNNATTDFGRLQFGGTTSSFPALKRSSTTLQARLADDSAFASVQGKLTTETAYTAGAPTATGYLVVYDSNGTAYRIPAVLN